MLLESLMLIVVIFFVITTGLFFKKYKDCTRDLALIEQSKANADDQIFDLKNRNMGLETLLQDEVEKLRKATAAISQINQEKAVLDAEKISIAKDVDRLEQDLMKYKETCAKQAEEISQTNAIKSNNIILENTLNEYKTKYESKCNDLTEKIKQLTKVTQELDDHKANEETRKALEEARFAEMSKKILGEQTNGVQDIMKNLTLPLTAVIENYHKEIATQTATVNKSLSNTENMQKILMEQVKLLNSSVKVIGEWGESQFESLLQINGLKEDIDYIKQPNLTNMEGSRARPDFEIKNVGGVSLFVDVKTPLESLRKYINISENSAINEEHKKAALKDLIDHIRQHAKDLEKRGYVGGKKSDSLSKSHNFVMLYIPFENILMEIFKHEPEFFHENMKKDIIIVSSTSAFAILQTLRHFKRQETLCEHANRIATEAGQLVSKFGKVVDHIESANDFSKKASNKLIEATKLIRNGSGNILRRIETITMSGAHLPASFDLDRTTRSLDSIIDNAIEIEESSELTQLTTES